MEVGEGGGFSSVFVLLFSSVAFHSLSLLSLSLSVSVSVSLSVFLSLSPDITLCG